jgi:hypothetical protein
MKAAGGSRQAAEGGGVFLPASATCPLPAARFEDHNA